MDSTLNHLNPSTQYSSTGGPIRREAYDIDELGLRDQYEEELLVYLGLLKDLPPMTGYNLPDNKLRHIPEGNKDLGWQNCLDAVEKYDRELCQTYREQIDTLLVFAGLFSAVVTAFAVESYQWLQDDPADTSVDLLKNMVALLAQSSNITIPPTPVSQSRLSDSAITRINCFWFLSLSLSLSAALVGILCKQWLREFERNVGQSPERALAVRYIRFQGFEYWNVGSIVTSVPIIMQMALALFMIGIIELLWRLHAIVACCVTIVAGLTLLLFLATTLLPAMQYAYICMRCCIKPLGSSEYSATRAFTEPQCAYKSAQAWLVFRIVQPVIGYLLRTYGHSFSSRHPPHNPGLGLRPADSGVTFDLDWITRREIIHHGPQCAFMSLAWVAKNLGDMHLSSSVWHCVWSRWLRNRDSNDTLALAGSDIAFVARSYPHIVPLSSDNAQSIRAQALVFQCSLRTDLSVETAIELLIRVAYAVGVNSQWTREALRALTIAYQDLTIHINDGLAVRLFRMAELQSHTLLFHPDGPNGATQLNAAIAFKDILVLLYRGSRLHNVFLPAMSRHALEWLRSEPPARIALIARWVFEDMMTHLESRASYGDDWRQFPGILLVARLAGAVTELWPNFVGERYLRPVADSVQRHPPVLLGLLAMLSVPDESTDPAQGTSGGAGTSQPEVPSGENDGGSNGPVLRVDAPVDSQSGEGAHAGPRDPLAYAGRASAQITDAQLCVDMHDKAMDAGEVHIDVNDPVSPTGSVVPPCLPLGSPMSSESRDALSSIP